VGSLDAIVANITNILRTSDTYTPFIEGLKKMVPQHLQTKKYPFIWDFQRHVGRVVRETLMSEYLGWKFAELFERKGEEELEELARSFSFEMYVKRDGLNGNLREDGRRGKEGALWGGYK
jgi:hypothetical protein